MRAVVSSLFFNGVKLLFNCFSRSRCFPSRMMEPANCVFTIRNRGKGIPYPGFTREDGTNHGFKALKGQSQDAIRANAEARDLPELQDALVRLNAPETGAFTVGCEKSFNREGERHWARGYVELAINYRELVGDALHYFKLFFEFNRRLHAVQFALPQYLWELEPAEFTDVNVAGFAVTVWVTTNLLSDEASARRVFGEALVTLADFLCGVGAAPLATLY